MTEATAEEYSPTNAPPLTKEQALSNLQSPDLSLRYYAAWWLGKFRVRSPAVVDALLAALEDETDRTEMGGYPLRRNAARALGKLGDLRAVPGLIKCLQCSDFYVREAAAQSLAMLKDKRAAQALMQLLEPGVAAAVQVPGRPHLTQPYEAILEALGAMGATEAIPLIEPFLEHPMPRVQCAAARAMYQLTRDFCYGEYLVKMLDSSNLQLRRVALADLGAIGYMPAAEAIAAAKVENSFKLLALKGLLEHQLQQESQGLFLTADAIRVMNLMDSLL
jgi:phycocyanobilin lyase alpha subunit|uniref:Phycocyanin lyase alpha subunit n=1 Tax=Fischerella sp. PCC 7603 TaxID=70809 RepID=Q8KT48_9CYAN|nr:phycocyanin lyase alpha subunit [Fischerella sp. PCC 7603]